MMEIDQEKVLEALKLIRDICSNIHCEDCPFGTRKLKCVLLTESPNEWRIADNEKKTWRAFNE